MRLHELIQRLQEIEQKHGSRLIIDVLSDTTYPSHETLYDINVCQDPQMGLDSLTLRTRQRQNGESL